MGHLGAPHYVDLLGLVAGTLGVSAAVWLQLVTPREVRPRYVMGFLVLGCALMLVNLEPVIPQNGDAVVFARGLAYIILIAAQAILAYHVWREAEVSPVQEAADILEGVVER